MNYVGFGWGNKEFYLTTPEWSDLKFSTAIKALFFFGPVAIHATFYKYLIPDRFCKKVLVSRNNYLQLISYIQYTFKKDSNDDFIIIKNLSYGTDDCFFEANGAFSPFFTCNTWANNCLKHAGLKACLWTPFDRGILFHY
jgi:uncharacterized protein (TIGR02117 family)